MKTYFKKVQAQQITEDMDLKIVVLYSGNLNLYHKIMPSMDAANEFIKNDEGKKYCDEMDKKHELIYESPVYCYNGMICNIGDYIVVDKEGNEKIVRKTEFENTYQEHICTCKK